MGTTVTVAFKERLRALLGDRWVIDAGDALETLSKDFYWYSPVLRRQLADKRAEVVIRPRDLDELRGAVSLCCRTRVPIVPRGGGTGNYGQCIPLFGGVVVDLTRFDRILSINEGVARVEAGARLGTIETKARDLGWELRCLPSTWVKSTIGGFFCGGSGGIGSITWGMIASPGNVKSVTVLTCEEEPRLLRLEEEKTLAALHTYGTTGFLVEIEMRLAPRVDYEQLIFSADWPRLLDWTDSVARDGSLHKREVSQFEWPVPSYFAPLRKHLRPGQAATFLLISRGDADKAVAGAAATGIDCVYRRPLSDPPKPPFITDYTWNHTTLWALRSDPSATYLQCGLGPNFREQIRDLQQRFPGELLFHLEWIQGTANAKMIRGQSGPSADTVVVAALPIVLFKSEERLNEIMDYCSQIGVFVANPHTYVLEDGGRHPNIAEKRALKREADPWALLNPGKMKTYPLEPASPLTQA
jgi:FAD/FMN-containing dehydrogenase